MHAGRKAAAAGRAPRVRWAQRRGRGAQPEVQQDGDDKAADMRRRQEEAYARLQNIKQEEEMMDRMGKVSYSHGKQTGRVEYDFEALEENVYDYLVIGSGFGGSVYAMRMAQKGYSVLVVEQGRRWVNEAPESDKDAWNTVWNPAWRMTGARQTARLGVVDVVSGVGLGGTSLIHTAHMARPHPAVFKEGSWAGVLGEEDMGKHFDEAERMLGVGEQPFITQPDFLAAGAAAELGLAAPQPAHTAAFFGKQKQHSVVMPTADLSDASEERMNQNPYEVFPDILARNKNVTTRHMLHRGALGTDGDTEQRGRVVWADPMYGGVGPARSPCTACGMCAVGCDKNAKNTMDRTYAFLAERRYGATVMHDTRADAVRFLGDTTDEDDSRYVVDVEWRPVVDRLFGSPVKSIVSDTKYGKPKKVRLNARNVVLGCGAVGTNALLLRMKEDALGLPELNDLVGRNVRVPHTSTVLCTPLDNDDDGSPMGRDYTKGPATTTYVADAGQKARVEVMRFGKSCSLSRYTYWPAAEGDSTLSRMLGVLKTLAANPFDTLRWLTKGEWTMSTVILRETRACDGTLTLGLSGKRLTAVDVEGDAATAAPVHAGAMAEKIGAAQGGAYVTQPWREAVKGVPVAHDMTGGAAVGEVLDADHQVLGYPGLFVVDGAAIPSDLGGADSALTVCALAERAAARVPAGKDGFAAPKLHDRTPWTTVEWKDMGQAVDDSAVKPSGA
eukprot:TRINITY_DN5042_c0_g7_i1.p1 TRINITY_DN5042_c0_g7~~TRINITY_DN5042_c0_g7_i1.p1  ORF type:complete len:727 (+),score=280.51 TRINITY_DN5042_c0_g7_i1:78-2258(+)